MTLTRLTLVLVAALTLTSCALFRPPPLACQLCWMPAPCTGEWVAVAESDGGGCMLVAPAGILCPYPKKKEE